MMKNALRMLMLAFLAMPCLCGPSLLAQQVDTTQRLLYSDPQEIIEYSKERGKMNAIVSVSDHAGLDVHEAPTTVQVITARQIEASGARDLYDVLQLVPGLSMAIGRDEGIGMAVHGNWAMDGRCLFLLNGQQLNENDHGTFAIGDRIPIANVERLEVTIGPGSALRGGYASMAVINIITRDADMGTGSRLVLNTGYSRNGTTRTIGSVSGAHRLSRDQQISYLSSHGSGSRSNALQLLPDSTLLDLRDSTGLSTTTFQFNYQWKELRAFMVYMEENYEASAGGYSVQYRDVTFGLEQKVVNTPKLDLTWRLAHSDQLPWYHMNTSVQALLEDNAGNRRSSGALLLGYKPSVMFSTRVGVQAYHQVTSYLFGGTAERFRWNNGRSVSMNDVAVFMEASVKGRLGMLTGSYRYEHNDLAGEFLAPRVAYTKMIGRFHAKAIWGTSYRLPAIMVLDQLPADTVLDNEYVTTLEGEVGMKLGTGAAIRLNAYSTTITDPMLLPGADVTTLSGDPGTVIGTRGADLLFQWETQRTTFMAGVGSNEALRSKNDDGTPSAGTWNGTYIGMPGLRGLLVLGWSATPWLDLNSRFTYQSSRYGHFRMDPSSSDTRLVKYPEELVANIGLTWRPGKSKRLSIRTECRDLLDAGTNLPNPLANGALPFARNGREYTLAVAYKFAQ